MVERRYDYQFRLILVGDSTVGKSSLLRYFADGKFAEACDPTVGVDFFARVIEVKDGTRIKLQLWDTAGQERFHSITKSYYRNSVGALLVYDICNRASFESIPIWMDEAKRHILFPHAAYMLVGCKKDLAYITGAREVKLEEAKEFAKERNIPHIETSAKSGAFVEDAFRIITEELYNRVKLGNDLKKEEWGGEHDFNIVEGEPAKSSCC